MFSSVNLYICFCRSVATTRASHKYLLSEQVLSRTLSNKNYTTNADASLKLTESCVKQLNKIADNKSYLRVQVDSGGCSGFQYRFTLDSAMNKDDNHCLEALFQAEEYNSSSGSFRVFEKDGAKVIVDNESFQFIKGSSIDYHQELIRSAFHVIDNPQAENGCSCGASFNIKI